MRVQHSLHVFLFYRENWQNYSYEIVCGAHNMELFEPTVQRRGVPHIIPVPSFNDSTFDNDIALMRLDKPLRWTEAVRPICIPDDMASVGTPCIVSGWGRTEGKWHVSWYGFHLNTKMPPAVRNYVSMAAPWHGNAFCITGILWGEPNGHLTTFQWLHIFDVLCCQITAIHLKIE